MLNTLGRIRGNIVELVDVDSCGRLLLTSRRYTLPLPLVLGYKSKFKIFLTANVGWFELEMFFLTSNVKLNAFCIRKCAKNLLRKKNSMKSPINRNGKKISLKKWKSLSGKTNFVTEIHYQ